MVLSVLSEKVLNKCVGDTDLDSETQPHTDFSLNFDCDTKFGSASCKGTVGSEASDLSGLGSPSEVT